jgi:hypothetical protein
LKISRNLKRGCALALAVLLALPCVNLMQARAAGPVVQDRDCELTVAVDTTETVWGVGVGAGASAEDFENMTVTVNVYKVADMNVSAEFTSTTGFEDLDFNVVMEDSNAATWENLAAEAVQRLEGVKPTATGNIEKGNPAVIGSLGVGMYLIVPQETFNSDSTRKYVFTPYLTALPSSDYTQTGAGSDDWQYDRTIYLKGEAQPQFGKLTINKTLQNYNATLGLTTSVFEIVGKDAQDNVVYTNVASVTHDGAGTESVTIENIPAGITVTVTEIYAGASYELVSKNEQTAVIVSGKAVELGSSAASVAFENKYNGGNDSGYGLMNEFKAGDEDGDWEWTKPTTPGVPQGPAEN